MAGQTSTIVLAQAETTAPAAADAVQNGVVVETAPVATDAAHPVTAESTAHVATTEAGHEAPTVFPPFDPSTFASQALWFILTFVFLYVVLSRVAMPQIGGILEKRKTRIEGDLKEAERLRGETDRAITAYETALAEARKNAHGIAEETRVSIKADLDGKRAVVESDLSAKMAEAEARILTNKQAALGNVDEIAADTVVALVTQLTGKVTAKEARDAVAQVVKQ